MPSLHYHSKILELAGARVCVAAFAPTTAGTTRQVLLLHGNPSHLDHFRALVPGLRRRAAVLACDHPGFGRSEDFTSGAVTLERSAVVALAVLDAMKVDLPVDVIGHSHGGMVAVAIAALAPGRVRSIVLLGTGGTPAHPSYRTLRALPGLATLLPWLARPLYRAPWLRGLARGVTRLAARASFAPDPVPEDFIDDELAELRARPELLGAMVRLALDDPCSKVAAHARLVRAPALVIHGHADALVGIAYARRLFDILQEATPASRFVTVIGGHMVHLNHADLISPVLDEWLAD